jgi:hypothetical protein
MAAIFYCDPYQRQLSIEFKNDIEFGIKILTRLSEKMEILGYDINLSKTIKRSRELFAQRDPSLVRNDEIREELRDKHLASFEEMEEVVKKFRSLGESEQDRLLEKSRQIMEKQESKRQKKKSKKKKMRHLYQKNELQGISVLLIKKSGSLVIVFSDFAIPFGFELIDYMVILAKNGIGELGFAHPNFIKFVEGTKKLMDFNNQPNSNLH